MQQSLSDQFAFRPTASTTAAIIVLLQQVSSMLLTNDFVAVISMDFSKAFDTVRHSTLMSKLGSLDLPDEIYNWLVNYFQERDHITKHLGLLSALAEINASVVQGSGIGPGSYIVCASDLHPLHSVNVMLKYADDTYLIVGSNNIATAAEEFGHISTWA